MRGNSCRPQRGARYPELSPETNSLTKGACDSLAGLPHAPHNAGSFQGWEGHTDPAQPHPHVCPQAHANTQASTRWRRLQPRPAVLQGWGEPCTPSCDPTVAACSVLSSRPARKPLQLCPEGWLFGGQGGHPSGPACPSPGSPPRPEVKTQVGVCSVPGWLPSEGPMQLRSGSAGRSGVARPLPHASEIPERPERWKPNLEGSQRPGPQQSEPENITIVPLETQVPESETP